MSNQGSMDSFVKKRKRNSPDNTETKKRKLNEEESASSQTSRPLLLPKTESQNTVSSQYFSGGSTPPTKKLFSPSAARKNRTQVKKETPNLKEQQIDSLFSGLSEEDFINDFDSQPPTQQTNTNTAKKAPIKSPPENTKPVKAQNKARKLPKNWAHSKEEKRLQKMKEHKKNNEERYSWLIEVEDINRHPADHPDYDPSTLYIPHSQYIKMTKFEQQFWNIKKYYFDTVLFFQKGKFFELYEQDADIGHKVLGLKITDRVNMRMAGVPISHFAQWASKLLDLGYKVARADEDESMKDMERRHKKEGKAVQSGSIINRKLQQVMTQATITNPDLISTYNANYLIAIQEILQTDSEKDFNVAKYGVSYVDSSTATFYIGEFFDDASRTQLETLLVQIKPKEILLEAKSKVSPRTMYIIKNTLKNPAIHNKPPEKFGDFDNSINSLSNYFGNSQENVWPTAISSNIHLQSSIAALGAIINYLEEVKIADELIPVGKYKKYDSLSESTCLLLDSQTLLNLEILQNSDTGSTEGTLLKLLDHCCTPFGHRFFREMVCCPLASKLQIDDRLNAVDDLKNDPQLSENLESFFSALPDLERLLARVNAGSASVQDLENMLSAFENIQFQMDDLFSNFSFKSTRLEYLCSLENNGGAFPDLQQLLENFEKNFSRKKTIEQGTVVPVKGFNKQYDKYSERVKFCQEELQEYLQKQQLNFKSNSICYKHMGQGKTPYQLEIPKNSFKQKQIPSSWTVMTETKYVARYHTPEILKLLPKLDDSQEELKDIQKGLLVKLLETFAAHHERWQKAIDCLAEIDCILSLVKVATRSSGIMVRPNFIDTESNHNTRSNEDLDRSSPFLSFINSRHPCISEILGSDSFIPNDVVLGENPNRSNLVLLTGPNMGGKSTILRQVCILVIMAQIGSYVPAQQATLSVVDRIFTRIGANDNILRGQSTFMVELQQTSIILRNATKNSLVIMDELGRGTSTFDGYSIAYSVVNFLASKIGCRAMFSTHYHMLTDEFEDNILVALYHMGCIAEEGQEDITFLYTLKKGACPKSYGMNVAKLAGMPQDVVERAIKISTEFENTSQVGQYYRARNAELASGAGRNLHQNNLLFQRLLSICQSQDSLAQKSSAITKIFCMLPKS